MILVVRSNKFRYIPGQRAPESQGGQVTSGTPNVTAVGPKGYNSVICPHCNRGHSKL